MRKTTKFLCFLIQQANIFLLDLLKPSKTFLSKFSLDDGRETKCHSIAIWLLLSILLLSACDTRKAVQFTISSTPVNLTKATFTPYPSPPATLTPTATPIPGQTVISIENIFKLEQISTWGNGRIIDFAYSSDGQVIAAATSFGVYFYDANNFRLIEDIKCESPITKITFSPDWQNFAVVAGSEIQFWSTIERKLLAKVNSQTDDISSIIYSPNGEIIASGSSDRTIRLWNTNNHELITSLENSRNRVRKLAFSQDGTLLAATGPGGFQIWDIRTGDLILSKEEVQSYFDSIYFTNDYQSLLTGNQTYDSKMNKWYGKIQLWQISDGKLLFEEKDEVEYFSASYDGKYIASTTSSGIIHLWEFKNGKILLRNSTKDTQKYLMQIHFSPNNRYVAALNSTGVIQFWELPNLTSTASHISQSPGINCLSVSHDGKMILTGGSDNKIRLLNSNTGDVIREIEGHSSEVTSIKFSPDDLQIASGSSDHTVRLWKVNDNSSNITLMRFPDAVSSIVYSSDGKIIAAASRDGTVKLWKGKSIIVLPKLTTRDIFDVQLAFSPDNKYLAIGLSDYSKVMSNSIFSDGNSVKFWNIDDNKILDIKLARHSWGVSDIVFSPNNDYLLTGGGDGKILLWKITNLEPLKIGFVPEQYLYLCTIPNYCSIQKIALASTGRFFVAARANGRLDIGSTSDVQKVLSKPNLDFSNTYIWPTSIAFSPDGKLIYVSGYDGLIRVWGIQ